MEKEAPHRDPSNVFDPEKAAPFLFAGGHPGWLGLTYLGHGEDWTEIRLPWREELMGDDVRRVIASGPIFSMLDMGGGIAIWTRAQRFVPIATLEKPLHPALLAARTRNSYVQPLTRCFLRHVTPRTSVDAVFHAPGCARRSRHCS